MTAAVRFVIGAALAMLLSALFPIEVYAQKVALVHADISTRADAVRAKLVNAGVTDVTIIDAGVGPTPTLSDLEQYQAVLTWSMAGYADNHALGDALADYVDQGGGVVQAVFSFDAGGPGLAGRWDSEAYSLFTVATAEVADPLPYTLIQPLHPIVNGAAFTHGPFAFISPSFVQGGGELIALWESGYPLIAARPGPHGGQIVGLNLYPFLGDAGPWMANALRFVAGPAYTPADGPSVALLAAGGASAGATDVRRKLRDLRLFSRIDVIDVASTTPTLAALQQYDAVLTWSSSPYGNPSGLGDALAAYIDDNRGVVEAVFSSDPGANLHLEGRWASEHYRPLALGATSTAAAPLSVLPVVPGHALLSGVSSFNGGASSLHSVASLDAATTLVANWSNGQPLAAFGTKPSGGRVVGLNMYPPSSDAESGLWDRDTDGARLMANALLFAANHFPTADAGADQSGAATSPAGTSFTLDATAADLDGDVLTYTWSGAVSATGPSIVVDVPPPPAPNKSHTLTVTLTVADGKGGEATDAIDLTVTDMVPPDLHDMPTGTISVESTNGTDATVPYGPVTATDAIDGDVPVTCSHSGAFPIGDTLVTCSASDSRGNSTSASFTVRVTRAADPEPEPEPGVPGRMFGRGFMHEDNWRYEFAFAAAENASGAERGTLLMTAKSHGPYRARRRAGRFESSSVGSVEFSPESIVVYSGTGRWNGISGYRFEVVAADRHNGRRSRDRVRITITSPTGEVVVHCEGALDGGNIFIRKFAK
jgi:hypothetical protein